MRKQENTSRFFLTIKEGRHKLVFAIAIILLILVLQVDVSFAGGKPTTEKAWQAFIEEYRVIVASISGIGALTSIMVFIFHFIKLGTMPSHPIQRREVMGNMLVSAICTALLGGITIILTLFYYIVFGL